MKNTDLKREELEYELRHENCRKLRAAILIREANRIRDLKRKNKSCKKVRQLVSSLGFYV